MTKIKLDKRNYRIHSEKNLSLIEKSMQDCGMGRSILIDSNDEIISGNGAYQTAEKLGVPVRIIETDGSELVVVKRTDLKTDDEKRKRLAIMDNSTSDTSIFDLNLLQQDFEIPELEDMGIDFISNEILQDDELMDNDSLPEYDTSKQLALSRMAIDKYLCVVFDENFTKQDFIDSMKEMFPDSNIDLRTQYCDANFKKKDMIND